MKNNKKKIIIITVTSFVLALFIGLIIFYFYYTSPSSKIKKSLIKEIKLVQNNISNINNSTYNYLLTAQNSSKKKKTNIKPISIDTNISFDLNKSNKENSNDKLKVIYDLLSNSYIDLTTDIDSKNKYIQSEIQYKYDSSKLNSNIYIDGSNVYFYSKILSEKYIQLNKEDNKETNFVINILNSGITLKEINYLLNIISESLSNTKISDKIKSNNETLKISDKVFQTKKDELIIDNELATRFVNSILSRVSKDENALKIIQKVSKTEDISIIKKKISEIYTSLNNRTTILLNEGQEISLITYTEGIFPKLVMQSLDYNINSELNGNITLINVSVEGYSNNVVFTQGDIKTTLKLNTNNNKYNIQLITNKDNQEIIGNLSGLISPKEIDVEYNISKKDIQLVNGKVKYSQSFESSKKSSALSFSFDASNTKFGKGSGQITSVTKQIGNVKKQDYKNAVKYSELNLNDSLLIKAKLIRKIPAISRILVME